MYARIFGHRPRVTTDKKSSSIRIVFGYMSIFIVPMKFRRLSNHSELLVLINNMADGEGRFHRFDLEEFN